MSIWWVVGAFLVGSFAGMLLFALMRMAAREGEQAAKAYEAAEGDSFGIALL